MTSVLCAGPAGCGAFPPIDAGSSHGCSNSVKESPAAVAAPAASAMSAHSASTAAGMWQPSEMSESCTTLAASPSEGPLFSVSQEPPSNALAAPSGSKGNGGVSSVDIGKVASTLDFKSPGK